MVLCELQRFEEAVPVLRRAIELDPECAPAHSYLYLGLSLWETGRLEEALSPLRRVVELEPRSYENWYNLSRVLTDLGRFEEAAGAAHRAIEIDPGQHKSYCVLGDALLRLGSWREAETALRKAIQLAPGDSYPVGVLATHLATCEDERHRDLKAAVALGRRAVELSTGSPDCWKALGMALYRAGELREAVEALATCNWLGGTDSFLLAMALARLGEIDKARDAFAGSEAWMRAHFPDDPDLKRLRAEAESVLEKAASGGK
jgi:tetratricopeptide (TPR) repeat protein